MCSTSVPGRACWPSRRSRRAPSEALGVDIDPWSVDNARENAGLNGVADRFENRLGSLDEVSETGFGLVLANILRSILVPMMPGLAARLAPGGTLVLAGILHTEREAILEATAREGLEILERGGRERVVGGGGGEGLTC